jgi:trehalose 6-phosphate synthase
VGERRKIIVVSNRAPVTYFGGPAGAHDARRGGGGLVTALSNLVSAHRVTWIASAMTDGDREWARASGPEGIAEQIPTGADYRLRLVEHDSTAYDGYYNVVSNPTLWFVQHYLWDLVRRPSHDRGLEHAWREGYLPVNAAFAEAVLDELAKEPEAVVFFHDYHLYLAPRLVREQAPEAALMQFVHIPWPQSDYWNVLPAYMRTAIFDGLLANDVAGLHCRRWQRNFLHSAADIGGATFDRATSTVTRNDRSTLVTAHPISVDTGEFDALKNDPRVLEHERRIVEARPEYLLVKVDRTDPSKNVVRGFQAFELFLDTHPELQRRVAMLTLLDPSRQDIPEYAEYLGAIQREARRVNDRFQQPDWTPIDLQIHDDFHQSVAAYKQYDALLVNAIFDGLNLVAKEGPLVNERDGVLILSENTGAYEELEPHALTVNPFDLRAQADAIYDALTMERAERRRRLEAIQMHVRQNDLARWTAALLSDLDSARASAGGGLRGERPETRAGRSAPA